MSKEKNDAILRAARNGDINTFLKEIELGADINSKDPEGYSFLQLFINNKHYDWLNKPKITKLLTPEIINSRDNEGNTVLIKLLSSINSTTPEMVQATEKLISLGAEINFIDSMHHTELPHLYKRYFSLAGTYDLDELDAFNAITTHKNLKLNYSLLKKFNALRKLDVIYGGKKLANKFDFFNDFNTGGSTTEGVRVLQDELETFIAKKYPNDQALERVFKLFTENYHTIEELGANPNLIAKEILTGKTFVTSSGSLEHLIGVSIEKKNNEIILSLAERGDWTKTDRFKLGKSQGIQTIHFPCNENLIELVINSLLKAYSSPHKDAREIIFEEIPNKLGSKFEFCNSDSEEILSKPYKIGICYYANPKLLLHDLFFKLVPDAAVKYKEFDLYLHEQALSEYKQFVPKKEQLNDLIILCEKIITQKEQQLKIRTAINNNNFVVLKNLLKQEYAKADEIDLLPLYTTFQSLSFPHKHPIPDWLKNDFNLNQKNQDGKTLLHLAIENRNFDTFLQLIKLGADPSISDNNGNTPIHLAMNFYHKGWFSPADFFKVIKDADLLNRRNNAGQTLLHLAVRGDNPDTFLQLVNLGADLTIGDSNGNTPFHYAAYYKHCDKWVNNPKFVALLNSKSINQQNPQGKTLLHFAVEEDRLEFYLKLMELGGDDCLTDNEHATPLITAVFNSRFSWFQDPKFQALLNAQKINMQDEFGNTALHYMLFYLGFSPNDDKIIAAQTLLNLGGDINKQNVRLRSPLMILFNKLHPLDSCLEKEAMTISKLTSNKRLQIDISTLKNFNAVRQLFVLFGGSTLEKQVGHLDEFYFGGTSNESIEYLTNNLKKFIDNIDPNNNFLPSILKDFNMSNFRNLYKNQDQTIQEILDGKYIIVESGSRDRILAASFQLIDNEVVLSFADRSEYAHQLTDSPNKVAGIQSIRFPADATTLKTVFEVMQNALSAENEKAYDLLFKQLPEKIHSTFQDKNSKGLTIQSSTTDNSSIGFFRNFKLLLKDLFSKHGPDGMKIYKEFSLFLANNAFDNYCKLTPNDKQNIKLVNACKEKLRIREAKEQNLNSTSYSKQKSLLFSNRSMESNKKLITHSPRVMTI